MSLIRKPVDPVPVSEMRKRFIDPNTICSVLRKMYYMTENSDVRLECRIAMAMAKKMQDKLSRYRDGLIGSHTIS